MNSQADPKRRDLPVILCALAVTFIPHVTWLPIWITLWTFSLWGICLLLELKQLPQPPRSVRFVLTIVGLVAVVISFGSYSIDACIALLSILFGVMPFETKSHRDKMVILAFACFFILTTLFYSTSLLSTTHLFAAVLATTTSFVYINGARETLGEAAKLSGRIILQALPLMIVSFVLFPRIPHQLVGISVSSIGKTGFSDSFSLGDVAGLVESGEVAFRATFDGPAPNSRERYWRGIVFNHYDGVRWSADKGYSKRYLPVKGQNEYDYEIILEPHNERWIFALDFPVHTDLPTAFMRSDHVLQSKRPVTKRLRYRVKSLSAIERSSESRSTPLTLSLPDHINPKTRALAERLRNEHGSDAALVDEVLDYLGKNNFTYTLNPPPLGSSANSIDTFLFETKKGYCEHFSAAFAFLLRSADIPTRVIGGYLGGELNPNGNYMIVRQSDAHVWNEVYLENLGWVRVDPTSVVSPGRIQGGLQRAVDANELPFFLGSLDGPVGMIWKAASLRWDSINHAWNKWVMDYSQSSQRNLLRKMGIERDSWEGVLKVTLIALVSLIGTVLIVILKYQARHRIKPDEIRKQYERLLKKLARAGIEKDKALGPMDFCEKLIRENPDVAPIVTPILTNYSSLRYGQAEPNEQLLLEFSTQVKEFRI